jgi:hypothetical protein
MTIKKDRMTMLESMVVELGKTQGKIHFKVLKDNNNKVQVFMDKVNGKMHRMRRIKVKNISNPTNTKTEMAKTINQTKKKPDVIKKLELRKCSMSSLKNQIEIIVTPRVTKKNYTAGKPDDKKKIKDTGKIFKENMKKGLEITGCLVNNIIQ